MNAIIIVYDIGPFKSQMSKTRIVGIHQTNLECAEKICQDNMLIPKCGAVGDAIYLCRDAPTTNGKANRNGTWLIADVYLGHYTYIYDRRDLKKNYSNYNSVIIMCFNSGEEIAVFKSNRVLNIRYLKGNRPRNIWINMRPRMALIYGTTLSEAKIINEKKEIPKENHPNIAGKGYYFWPDIPSAEKYGERSVKETFFVADVFFTNPFENRNNFPTQEDLLRYDSFRGQYKETCYFMVKYPQRIANIHYIDGKRP